MAQYLQKAVLLHSFRVVQGLLGFRDQVVAEAAPASSTRYQLYYMQTPSS